MVVVLQFCRVYLNDGPEDTTLFRWANPIQPKTPEQFNQRIIQLSVGERLGFLEEGGMVRGTGALQHGG